LPPQRKKSRKEIATQTR